MRVIIAFVIFVLILIAGYFIFFNSDDSRQESAVFTAAVPGRSVEPAPLPENMRMREVEIRQRAAKAGGQMKLLAVALGAYKADNGAYPKSLNDLTTPIAYILKGIPLDPFAENLPLSYKVEENGDWLLWSVGPDAMDAGGRVEYDQEAGTGDILFRTSDAPSRIR
jgi:Type II secretion system (T2SS), protein G